MEHDKTGNSDLYGNIWRIDLTTKDLRIEPVPDSWSQLGGRALIARVLLDEVPPNCEPLGQFNKLIFAPGLLVGHRLSSCDRISIGSKSPLTHGVKEANAGGKTGLHMARLGIKGLILEGGAANNSLWTIYLNKDGMKFLNADDLRGLGVYECAKILVGKFGKKVAISLIGPAGEMKLKAAGIQNLDKDQVPSRIAARGGLGAVMGTKGVKAVVFDDEGCSDPPVVDVAGFNASRKGYNKALSDHPQTKVYFDYGTAAMTQMCNGFGGMPTRNFSSGVFEDADKISGEYLRDILLKRGGQSKTTHACMVGCSIQCSNVFGDAEGEKIVSPIEYETIGLMGSNLGISDLDTIAKLNYEVNDLGLDSIEIGAALGVTAEAGLVDFGDGSRALELVNEIRIGSALGRILGNGVDCTGNVLGIERIPAVKKQAISAYDPRAIKGTGVTYATSPQGADHTSGLTIRANIDHLNPEGQVEVSRTAQFKSAGYDSLGVCAFAGFGFSLAPELISKFLNCRYGWEVTEDIVLELGKKCIDLEIMFNKQAGFTNTDDRIPEWMTLEQLPPHNSVFDVPDAELDSIFA